MPCNNFWLNGESLHDLGDDHLINARAWLNRNRERLIAKDFDEYDWIDQWDDGGVSTPTAWEGEDLDSLAEAMDEELKRRYLVL